jgi:hypothetical protein
MDIKDPEGYRALARYLAFPGLYPFLYEARDSAADIALVWPRTDVQAGNKPAAEAFRDAGRKLSESQVVMDALVDGWADSNRLARYGTVLVPEPAVLEPALQERLDAFARQGGRVLRVGTNNVAGLAAGLKAASAWSVEAPWTVKAMAWKGKGRRVLHLVNYDRDEARAAGLPKKPQGECPVPATNIACRLILPGGAAVSGVRLYVPEEDRPETLKFEVKDGSVFFVVPKFEVYGVVEIRGRRL